jgi:hypothetical protein
MMDAVSRFSDAVGAPELWWRFRTTDVGGSVVTRPFRGDLERSFNHLDLAADHGMTIFAYTPEPGSKSAETMGLLGSCAATLARE